MDHCKDSENVIMHSILCVKLEPFDEDEDCTQNLDPLQPDSNVHTQMELLQDFKTEIESDCSDQAVNELIQDDMLNDLGDTGTKIEQINIKTEYIGNEASALDDVLDSRGIIEGDNIVHSQLGENSRQSEHGCIDINQQFSEKNTTRYEPSHSCETHSSDVINSELTKDANTLNATSPANQSRARSDSSSSGVDDYRIHRHSTSEEEGSKQSLIGHSLPHSSYVCDVCDKTFKDSRNLVKHKVVHAGQKPYVCDICKKGFSHLHALVRHKRIHSSEKPYECDICQKGFIHSHHLVTHKHSHTGQKPYVCDICKKGFSRSSNLVVHKRSHTGQKPYVCEICNKGFIHSSDLVKHKRIHTGEKPYVCDICKRGFSHSSTLATHKRSHTGQKPYVCDICKKGFSRSSYLLIHKRIHSGEKPYVCDICKKGFSDASNLAAHKRTHHGQKPC